MSRRSTPKKRTVIADPIYHSRLVSMLINRILKDGKKTLAKKILIVFYKTAVLHIKNYFFDNHFVQLFQTRFYQKYKILGKEGEIEGRFFKYNYWSSQSLNHSVTR